MLSGMGKTGYGKIDFEEAKVLRGMDAFVRLDQSIMHHTTWSENAKAGRRLGVWAGLLAVGVGALLIM